MKPPKSITYHCPRCGNYATKPSEVMTIRVSKKNNKVHVCTRCGTNMERRRLI